MFKSSTKAFPQHSNTGKSDEKSEDIVRSFENAEDPQVTEDLFQTVGRHVPVSTQNLIKNDEINKRTRFTKFPTYLNGFIGNEPDSDRKKRVSKS